MPSSVPAEPDMLMKAHEVLQYLDNANNAASDIDELLFGARQRTEIEAPPIALTDLLALLSQRSAILVSILSTTRDRICSPSTLSSDFSANENHSLRPR